MDGDAWRGGGSWDRSGGKAGHEVGLGPLANLCLEHRASCTRKVSFLGDVHFLMLLLRPSQTRWMAQRWEMFDDGRGNGAESRREDPTGKGGVGLGWLGFGESVFILLTGVWDWGWDDGRNAPCWGAAPCPRRARPRPSGDSRGERSGPRPASEPRNPCQAESER